MPSGDTPSPTPVVLITDQTAATIVGEISRLVDDLVVVPVEDARKDALPMRAVVAVADPERAGVLLDEYAAGMPATSLQFALPDNTAPHPRVLESLARYDATAIIPTDGASLIALVPAARRPGTAALWTVRLAGAPQTTQHEALPPHVLPSPASPSPEPSSAHASARGLQSIARRVASHRPTLAGLGLAVVLVSALLAMAAFPGNLAAVVLVALLCTLSLGAVTAAALGNRAVRRAANGLRRNTDEVRTLAKKVSSLEDASARVRTGVAGVTVSSAVAAVAAREMLNEVAQQDDLRDAIRQLSTSVDSLFPRLAEVESTAASTHRFLAGGARAWDITKLHDDLLNDQQAMAQLLARHQPKAPLPPVSGWAMNPTGLLWLVDHVERTRPALVLECGSGTSTLWLATALRRVGAGKVISIDHDPEYATRTTALLEQHDLLDWAEVRFCPLVEVATGRGTYSWYDLDLASVGTIDLLLVDGPPGTTGPHARYPAVPVLSRRLADEAVVALDDTGRPEEQEVLEFWQQDDPALESLGEVARGMVALRHHEKRGRA